MISVNRVIFTFSCAGGRAANFERWEKRLDVKIVNLEYPGHWNRWQEPLTDDYLSIIDDFERIILEHIHEAEMTDIFLAGHSLGALLAWLMAERLCDRGIVGGIIIIAMSAPSKIEKLKFRDLNNANEIKRFLNDIRQVPEKTLNSSLFNEYIYPVVENDFKLFNEIVNHKSIFNRLRIPCLVLYSVEDTLVEVKDVLAWNEYAENIEFSEMRGNHFFPYSLDCIPLVRKKISEFLNNDVTEQS